MQPFSSDLIAIAVFPLLEESIVGGVGKANINRVWRSKHIKGFDAQ